MPRFSKKQYLIAGAAALGLLGTAGGAYAYWTTSGTGSGSATTGTSSNFVVTTDAATGGPLTPGGPSESVAIHVNNPSTGHQVLNSVHVTVAKSDGSAWTSGSCSAADFTVTDPTFASQNLGPGATYNTSATIVMIDRSANQDDCKSVTVPLYVQASS